MVKHATQLHPSFVHALHQSPSEQAHIQLQQVQKLCSLRHGVRDATQIARLMALLCPSLMIDLSDESCTRIADCVSTLTLGKGEMVFKK
jgi:hypothetical protein